MSEAGQESHRELVEKIAEQVADKLKKVELSDFQFMQDSLIGLYPGQKYLKAARPITRSAPITLNDILTDYSGIRPLNPNSIVKMTKEKEMLKFGNGEVEVEVNDNVVSIDNKKVIVRKDGLDNYYINAGGFSKLETSSTPNGLNGDVQKDPHYYYNGNNGLTVNQSVSRAMEEVNYIHYKGRYSYLTDDEKSFVKEAVRTKIVRGDGRDSVYALAGGIVKGYKNGLYKGVPFDVVFSAAANGRMNPA